MPKKKPAKKVSVVGTNTVVTNANESIQEFLFRKLKTTKFILIAESLSPKGNAYLITEDDRKRYRSPLDYIGMMEGARDHILASRKPGFPE